MKYLKTTQKQELVYQEGEIFAENAPLNSGFRAKALIGCHESQDNGQNHEIEKRQKRWTQNTGNKDK